MTIRTHSEKETEQAGCDLAVRLPRGVVLALYGDLGAGKTAFTRGLARGLGVAIQVTSPTYTIVNEYEGVIPLIHFDMYRLRSAEELFEIGWEDYLRRGAVIAVEWSERVEDAFLPDTIRIQIEKTGETARRITITGFAGEESTLCGY
ncbi:MAG: tRNA (adenosine(37)-N6)-threonylcarbamoyltransferase complex ATPase subunit type 1 TsaE [Oscillospiraceae bacterium]|nr:tRNA (adenosine(37)-N6)-threonylcarbamoyltransferase complex ATPase subunit type 1 TsaE [Oscillospiraceae bacterium]